MSKLLQTLWLLIVFLVVLAAASRPLAGLIHSAVPLVCVGGLVSALLRIVWAVTRRW